jgi:hypothetical protein
MGEIELLPKSYAPQLDGPFALSGQIGNPLRGLIPTEEETQSPLVPGQAGKEVSQLLHETVIGSVEKHLESLPCVFVGVSFHLPDDMRRSDCLSAATSFMHDFRLFTYPEILSWYAIPSKTTASACQASGTTLVASAGLP